MARLQEELLKDAQFPKREGRPEEFAKLALFIIENPLLNGDVIRLECVPHAEQRAEAGSRDESDLREH